MPIRSRSPPCPGTLWTWCGSWSSPLYICCNPGARKAMAEGHTQPNYIAIFWWLLALTILEVGVIFMPLARVLIAVLLVGLAMSKASLVAMYFMHLKFERKTLGLIAMTPLLLCVLLVFALLPDLSATPTQTVEAPAPSAAP